MQKQYLAFDVGGSTIKYALINQDQTISGRASIDTKHNQDGAILKQLVAITKQMQTAYPLAGVGVSTAGIVDDHGAIQFAGPTIPEYQGTPIKATLSSISQLPTFVVNDVDAALLGEQIAGVAKNANPVYCIALGTGIGGAFSLDGRLYAGRHGNANSIGYTNYQLTDGTNYEQRAATVSLATKLKPYSVSVQTAFKRAQRNESPFVELISQWATEVAAGLANIILLLDPEILVIGGAVAQQGEYLAGLLQNALQQYLPTGLLHTKLRISHLANDAQLYGAVSDFLK